MATTPEKEVQAKEKEEEIDPEVADSIDTEDLVDTVEIETVDEDIDILDLLEKLAPTEATRYEQFRRSFLDRGVIKRCMQEVVAANASINQKPPNITPNMTIIVAGMAKSFVGDLTTRARKIMEAKGEAGAIRPRHLREAHRQYQQTSPYCRSKKRLL